MTSLIPYYIGQDQTGQKAKAKTPICSQSPKSDTQTWTDQDSTILSASTNLPGRGNKVYRRGVCPDEGVCRKNRVADRVCRGLSIITPVRIYKMTNPGQKFYMKTESGLYKSLYNRRLQIGGL